MNFSDNPQPAREDLDGVIPPRHQRWVARQIPDAHTVTVDAGHACCTMQSEAFVPGQWRTGGGCLRVNGCFPKSSSDDDDFGKGAVVEVGHEPWWANEPELIEIRRRTFEEFDRKLEQREPSAPNAPDPAPRRSLDG